MLPENTPYKNIFAINPFELSAELCTMYWTEKMEERSIYEQIEYNSEHNVYQIVLFRTIDINKYLTPQIRQWLETYMILPEIAEEDVE